MKKITTMDRDAAKAIRIALDRGLPGIAEPLGLKAHALKATFNPESGRCEFKIEFSLAEVNGMPREQAEFNAYCHFFDLTPEHFGQTFRSSRGPVKIVGLDMKRRSFPIVAMTESGERLGFKPEAVLSILNRTAAATAATLDSVMPPRLTQHPAPPKTKEA